MTLDIPNLKDFDNRLREEAHEEPTLEIPQGEPTKKTQIIAIYGKGGIGKSVCPINPCSPHREFEAQHFVTMIFLPRMHECPR